MSFSDVGDYLVSQFATTDNYSTDFQIFTLNGLSVGVENDLLSEALRELPDKKREILLLFYFMDMSDSEIADLLKLNRSTVYRHRTSGLALIMSDYKFDCPHCGQSLEAHEDMLGETIDCPSCGGTLELPKPEPAPPPRPRPQPPHPQHTQQRTQQRQTVETNVKQGALIGGVVCFVLGAM